MTDNFSDDWDGLLFAVRRSVRYHSRREGFFAGWHRFVSFVSVLFGSATVTTLLSNLKQGGLETAAIALALMVTFVGALDLVFAFSEKARAHSDLKRRFLGVEICMGNASNEERFEKCRCDRLLIEGDEPPKKFALDIMCHNELLDATGYKRSDPEAQEYFRYLSWWQRMTANVWGWNRATFISLAERNKPKIK